MQEEVEEVEAKLEASEQQAQTQWQRMLARLCTPVFLEALILTFLAGSLLSAHLTVQRWYTPQLSDYNLSGGAEPDALQQAGIVPCLMHCSLQPAQCC